MTTSLRELIASSPSGRTRPVLLDVDDYAVRVVRQGNPIPWLDQSAATNHVNQVVGLLDADAVWLDVGDLYAAYLADNDQLRQAMGAKTRSGYALRTMLGDDDVASSITSLLRTIAAASRRPLVLDVPSPGVWVAQAHEAAGTALDEVDENVADSASMYVAEWLGRLGDIPVALLLLDTTVPTAGTPVVAEQLSELGAIVNVAQHFDWTLALRTDEGCVTTDDDGDCLLAELPAEYWSGDGEAPTAGAALIGKLPSDATPEAVLSQLAALN